MFCEYNNNKIIHACMLGSTNTYMDIGHDICEK